MVVRKCSRSPTTTTTENVSTELVGEPDVNINSPANVECQSLVLDNDSSDDEQTAAADKCGAGTAHSSTSKNPPLPNGTVHYASLFTYRFLYLYDLHLLNASVLLLSTSK